VVQDRQLLVEAVSDRASPDDGELRVDVHRPGSRYEEEAGLEILQVVDRERVQALAVDRQDPAREEARVVGEEAGRIGQRGLDVTPRVGHDEGVAVEDLDEVVVHVRRFA
jgi:hypothetical protein